MKIAIMQPYFFPYIGYYQMINAVDRFILYDDVNYIKGGWISRNRILNGNNPLYVHLILNKASPNKRINEISLNNRILWRSKLLKQIQNLYVKATYFDEVFPLLRNIINFDASELTDYLFNCISQTCKYLGISAEIITSSNKYGNRLLERQERLIDICKKEGASHYINAIGGNKLYSKEIFKKNGIKLSFMDAGEIEYKQFRNDFIPNLSIIDVMMFNSKEDIKSMLTMYELK